MIKETEDMLMKVWCYLKEHDIPNWIVFAFSIIVWPIIIYMWSKRTQRSIRNLQIIVDPASGVIPTGENCPYLVIRFENFSGMNVYVANATIKVTQNITAHRNADRDLSTGNYTLKFAEATGEPFTRLQTTITTGNRVTTGLPLDKQYSQQGSLDTLIQELRSHKRNLVMSKFFTLEFEAMVGGKHKRIRFKV